MLWDTLTTIGRESETVVVDAMEQISWLISSKGWLADGNLWADSYTDFAINLKRYHVHYEDVDDDCWRKKP